MVVQSKCFAPQRDISLTCVLEIFNNQLVYQWEGASALVVNLLRLKHLVKELQQDPTVSVGMASLESQLQLGPQICWKDNQLLGPLKALIEHIDPKIDTFCEANPEVSEEDLEAIVKRCTLVGLVPQHRIIVRGLDLNAELEEWLFVRSWVRSNQSVIYATHNASTFSGTSPKLLLEPVNSVLL